jgi:hypothetical protein
MRAHQYHIGAISLGLAALLCTASALPRRHNGTYHHSCRLLPGDAHWPTVNDWQKFNTTVHGRLIATTPLAQPCHGDSYDAGTCDELKSEWDLPWIQ